MKTSTSISDYFSYKNVCLEASKNEEAFSKFKQNSEYTTILEHTSKEYGQKYIDFILKTGLDLSKINKFKENDEQGNPTKVEYLDPFGLISPSTLRYVKVLSELESIFGSLANKKIVEIGVGYGGQSKLIMDYFNIDEYNFVDLPEVLGLTKKYLEKYGYKNLNYYTYDSLPEKNYDIVISNYAFTECNKGIQKIYLEKIINKSKSGYITGNQIGHHFNVDMMNREEIKNAIPNSKLIAEVPLTHPNNYILTWDNHGD